MRDGDKEGAMNQKNLQKKKLCCPGLSYLLNCSCTMLNSTGVLPTITFIMIEFYLQPETACETCALQCRELEEVVFLARFSNSGEQ